MDVTVELNCDKCGSANISLPDDAANDGPVGCNDCGAEHGSFAELTAELVGCARAHGAEARREKIARLGGSGNS